MRYCWLIKLTKLDRQDIVLLLIYLPFKSYILNLDFSDLKIILIFDFKLIRLVIFLIPRLKINLEFQKNKSLD